MNTGTKLSIHLPKGCGIDDWDLKYLDGFKNINIKRKGPEKTEEGKNTSDNAAIKVKNGVLKVAKGFDGTTFGDDIEVPKTVKKIDLSSGKSIRIIDVSACSNLPYLEEIILPPELEIIRPYAFSKCKNLKKVKFNADDTLNIKRNAFKGAKAQKVVIGMSVKKLIIQDDLEFAGIEKVSVKRGTKLYNTVRNGNNNVKKEDFFKSWVKTGGDKIQFPIL